MAIFIVADSNCSTGALGGREAYFYHSNPKGDIYALSDESGSIVERYDYTLFGEVEVTNGSYTAVTGNVSQYKNPFQFAGAFRDEEIDNIWMCYRYYDSSLRAFISRYPAEDDSLSNLYTAFENHSGQFIDPWGLKKFTEMGFIPLIDSLFRIEFYDSNTESFILQIF